MHHQDASDWNSFEVHGTGSVESLGNGPDAGIIAAVQICKRNLPKGLPMSDTSRLPKSGGKKSSRSGEPRSEEPRLPPRVVKKKKSIKVKSVVAGEDREPADPPSEFLVPVILIGVSLVIDVITSLILRPESVSPGLWLGIRIAMIL